MFLLFLLVTMKGPEVTNDTTPRTQTPLVFDELFRLGGEEPVDHLEWHGAAVSVQVNHKGHLFVVDPAANRILEFTPDGEFVRQVGRKGDGPGEFQTLTSLQFLGDGSAVVFEVAPGVLPTISRFDDRMQFVNRSKTTSMAKIPTMVQYSPDGSKLAGAYVSLGADGMAMVTGVMDSDFNDLMELARVNQSFDQTQFMDPGYLSGFCADVTKNAYTSASFAIFDKQGRLYTAHNAAYKVKRHNPDLKEELVFSRKAKAQIMGDETIAFLAEQAAEKWRVGPMASMINDGFIRSVKRKLELPPVQSHINGLLVDDQGNVMVVNKLDRLSGDQTLDFFDNDGRYQGKVTLPHWSFVSMDGAVRMVFHDGHAYTVQTDEDDINRIIKYSYGLQKR